MVVLSLKLPSVVNWDGVSVTENVLVKAVYEAPETYEHLALRWDWMAVARCCCYSTEDREHLKMSNRQLIESQG